LLKSNHPNGWFRVQVWNWGNGRFPRYSLLDNSRRTRGIHPVPKVRLRIISKSTKLFFFIKGTLWSPQNILPAFQFPSSNFVSLLGFNWSFGLTSEDSWREQTSYNVQNTSKSPVSIYPPRNQFSRSLPDSPNLDKLHKVQYIPPSPNFPPTQSISQDLKPSTFSFNPPFPHRPRHSLPLLSSPSFPLLPKFEMRIFIKSQSRDFGFQNEGHSLIGS